MPSKMDRTTFLALRILSWPFLLAGGIGLGRELITLFTNYSQVRDGSYDSGQLLWRLGLSVCLFGFGWLLREMSTESFSVLSRQTWMKIGSIVGGMGIIIVFVVLHPWSPTQLTAETLHLQPSGAQNAFGKDWLKTSGLANTRIAFLSDYPNPGLYLMNADGSGQTRIVERLVQSSAWSPDGSRLVFAQSGIAANSGLELWVVNRDGSGKVRLASGKNPAWSPDGKKMAYETLKLVGSGVGVITADGSGQVELDDSGESPAWSPDGKKVAYRDRMSGLVFNGIWVVNTDGSGKTQLAKSGSSPAWSSAGSSIAYEDIGPQTTYIYLMNSDGTGQKRLTSKNGTNPAWSPDGSMIAYEYADAGTYGIGVIKADGTGQKNLTSGKGRYANPTWSPDGSMIAYMSSDKSWAVNIVRADGTKQAQVTESGAGWYPVWSPFFR